MDDINKILAEYTEEVTNAITEVAEEIGNECVAELKNSQATKRTGKYNKGWSAKVNKGNNFINVTVHNKTGYRLTHLLENGHATRNGQRTKPIVHIKPVEEKANKEFESAVIEIIKNGGK